jgi:chromosome segregation ATPase
VLRSDVETPEQRDEAEVAFDRILAELHEIERGWSDDDKRWRERLEQAERERDEARTALRSIQAVAVMSQNHHADAASVSLPRNRDGRMTGREQVRRDAQANVDTRCGGFAKTILALLAELEQAERELDEAQDDAKRWQNRATILGKERQSVPALVEALRDLLDWAEGADTQIHSEWGVGQYEEDPLFAEIRQTIAAFEQE